MRNDFSVRYSPQFGPNQTATFALQNGESFMMLAVAAHLNYRDGQAVDTYPYQLNIRGATPAAGTT